MASADRAAPGEDAQVVIVGAGPGGSTAAYHLARAGIDSPSSSTQRPVLRISTSALQ